MNKLIFLNTGWMDFYQGVDNDKISGGGRHVDKHGWGGEVFNFKNFQDKFYGYVQPKIDKKYNSDCIIKLERIGASPTAKKLDGVTVVWTAKEPNSGGTHIIGWYKNATVYRKYQEPPKSSRRVWKGHEFGFYVVAKIKDCKLLPKDERVVRVRRREKNWMGQSNVWYADKNPEFVNIVQDYIFKGIIPTNRKPKGRGTAKQSDPLKRIEVEKKAVSFVSKYYEKLGYSIDSFEKDNVGWDLTATKEKTKLKLEVKGLSGKDIATELTPNEFKHLKADTRFYRLCIVTETLIKPNLKVFTYSNDNDKWTSEDGTTIEFQEITSARIYAT